MMHVRGDGGGGLGWAVLLLDGMSPSTGKLDGMLGSDGAPKRSSVLALMPDVDRHASRLPTAAHAAADRGMMVAAADLGSFWRTHRFVIVLPLPGLGLRASAIPTVPIGPPGGSHPGKRVRQARCECPPSDSKLGVDQQGGVRAAMLGRRACTAR